LDAVSQLGRSLVHIIFVQFVSLVYRLHMYHSLLSFASQCPVSYEPLALFDDPGKCTEFDRTVWMPWNIPSMSENDGDRSERSR
jgi:hypothetical protein